jgi:hypothetical protein
MRLPHSNAQYLYLSALPVAALALLLTMFSARAQAASTDIQFSPAGLSYGNVVVGESQTMTLNVTNGGKKSVTISSVTPSNGNFQLQKLKLPQVVAAGSHVAISVIFTPAATGKVDAKVNVGVSDSASSVGSTSSELLAFGLSGTGTQSTKSQLTITPSTLNFGDVAVGGTGTQAADLTASGGSVTISSASSSSSLFAMPGVVFPLTIASGKSVPVNVTFTPQKSGDATGKLSFTSNASDSTASNSVSGTGTTPFVSISWNASTSQSITGYNVYRSTTPKGTYVKLNSSLVKATTYTDTNVPKGSYAYAATAVNSKGVESTYSSQIDVVVP